MKLSVGEELGVADGLRLGKAEGSWLIVGFALGSKLADGTEEGAKLTVGTEVGPPVGTVLGSIDGIEVG